ncbi:MAG: hydroxyacylglutathione hydrolase [Acetobacteraceae bacterium]
MKNLHPIPLFADNYAWLLTDAATGAVGVVDPADAGPVIEAVAAGPGRLDLILLTHHHADHIAGAEAVKARFGAAIVGASADRHRLPPLDRAVAEGDEVALGASRARVLATPGHTRGHIAFFFEDFAGEGPLLVAGDTLFSLGCGRLLEGTAEEMFASLAKLAALPGGTLLAAGHEYTAANGRFALTMEPENAALARRLEEVARLRAAGLPSLPVRLAEEFAANPFLRARDVASFARLRAAKDAFKG